MEFLNKIEEFINNFLFKVGALLQKLLLKYTPEKILLFHRNKKESYQQFKVFLRALPKNSVIYLKALVVRIQAKIKEIDINGKIQLLKEKANEFKNYVKTNKFKDVKKTIAIPISFVKKWFQGLSPTQTVFLTTFTAASFVAAINIISSSNRLAKVSNISRTPASEKNEFEFDRPKYYKKNKKHVLMSNVRLPVYHENVNDLKTVDIDFNVTLSNRHSRNALEKLEFQMRDFLILKIEPQVPEFMLVDEGKEILRRKIWREIDEFLKARNINGKVVEVQITYVLAN